MFAENMGEGSDDEVGTIIIEVLVDSSVIGARKPY